MRIEKFDVIYKELTYLFMIHAQGYPQVILELFMNKNYFAIIINKL